MYEKKMYQPQWPRSEIVLTLVEKINRCSQVFEYQFIVSTCCAYHKLIEVHDCCHTGNRFTESCTILNWLYWKKLC